MPLKKNTILVCLVLVSALQLYDFRDKFREFNNYYFGMNMNAESKNTFGGASAYQLVGNDDRYSLLWDKIINQYTHISFQRHSHTDWYLPAYLAAKHNLAVTDGRFSRIFPTIAQNNNRIIFNALQGDFDDYTLYVFSNAQSVIYQLLDVMSYNDRIVPLGSSLLFLPDWTNRVEGWELFSDLYLQNDVNIVHPLVFTSDGFELQVHYPNRLSIWREEIQLIPNTFYSVVINYSIYAQDSGSSFTIDLYDSVNDNHSRVNVPFDVGETHNQVNLMLYSGNAYRHEGDQFIRAFIWDNNAKITINSLALYALEINYKE